MTYYSDQQLQELFERSTKDNEIIVGSEIRTLIRDVQEAREQAEAGKRAIEAIGLLAVHRWRVQFASFENANEQWISIGGGDVAHGPNPVAAVLALRDRLAKGDA